MPKTIVIDCERMKYPHTGLYHYCQHLGRSLLATNSTDRKLCFYTPPAVKNVFGPDQCYLPQHPYHKLLLPAMKDVELWHSTHQSTDYFPAGKDVRIVLTVHDLNYLYDKSKSDGKRLKYVESLRDKITRADHIVVISQFTKDDLDKVYDLTDKPCTVIYNGCNIEEITALAPPAYPPPQRFLFTIGTIVEKKNFHVLPPLLQHNDMVLLVSGITQSEAYKAKIMEEAKKWGVESRVVFTGPVSENDKQWYMKHCTAFLFPSLSEGFGLPVVEAMYFGKPVLLSRHTCLPEIGGEAAYYFEDFIPESMQETLAQSLDDFQMNNRSALVKERALFFNWEKSAAQYHQVYKSLLT